MEKGNILKNSALKLLILEDSIKDKELITEQLTEAGYYIDVTHAEAEDTFTEALKKFQYDVIISDFALPGFDAFGALSLCQEICPEVPFICVSGSIGEERAIELLKKGAVDYVLKDRPERLPYAIQRALDEAKEKSALLKAEHLLTESEARFRQVAETAQEWIWEVDTEGRYTYSSPLVETLLGFTPDELVGKKHFYDFYPPEEKEKLKNRAFKVFSKKGVFRNYENTNIHKNGQSVILSTSGSPIFDDYGNFKGYRGVDEDITERKQAEDELQKSKRNLEEYFENDISADYVACTSGEILSCNKTFLSLFGFEKKTETDEFNISNLYRNPKEWEYTVRKIKKGRKIENYEVEFVSKEGKPIYSLINAMGIFGENSNLEKIRGYIVDITEQKLAEGKLKESEVKFRNLFYYHAAVKLIIDPKNGNIIEANKAAATFYGWPVETLQTLNISQINALPLNELNNEMKRARSLKKTNFEFKHRKADGKLVDVEVFSSAIKVGDRDLLHSIIHDITEKKNAEEQLKILNRAVEASPVAVSITDIEGNIIFTNPGFTKISGYSLEEVIGQNQRLLKSGLQAKSFYKELWDTILSGDDWKGEFQNKKKNGELYWVNAFISPIVNNSRTITHFVAIQEDITERKKMVEELVEAKEIAEESDLLKTAFLANMSHEIRTPMNGILGFTELLLEPDLSSEQKESYINIVHQSGQRMLNTVNDIIEISKIEAGLINVSKKVIDINESVEELIRFFWLEVENKELTLTLESLLPEEKKNLLTDQNKLDSILTNLIKNAIKYTDKGVIKVGCSQKNQEIEFYVKDTGIGIPAHRQAAVFNRFEQADIADIRAFEGSGLGLTIVKSYVEMLGGKIWVESEEGKGSAFYFSLPAISHVEEKTNAEKEISFHNEITISQISGLKILIAEDDAISRQFLSILIEDFVSEILEAETGIEAIEHCRNNNDIDLVLMDIKMPGLDGYQATQRIREFNKNVVIIAQTAYSLSGDREIAIKSGCNDYISKPINKTELQTLISKYFTK